MFLGDITQRNNDTGSDKLAEQGVQKQYFNKQFQQQVVDDQISCKRYKVAEQLDAAFEIWIYKDNIFHQHKPHHKIYTKGNK